MKRVLFISTNAIGDTYIVCSAFAPLKELYPDIKIDMVALSSSAFFLEKIGFNKLFLLKKKSYPEVVKQLRQVRRIKYDLVLNFFPGQVNSFFFQFSSSRQKAGFRNIIKQIDWHNADDTVITIPSKPGKEYVWKKTDNFLKRIILPLKAAGIQISSLSKPFFNIAESNSECDIVMHLFSSDKRKSFSYEQIAGILKSLSKETQKKICLIGNNDEIVKVKECIKIDEQMKNIMFLESPEIERTVAMMKGALLFIGVDSFPLHIADAHSIKTLAIFTQTDENSVLQNMHNKFILRIDEMNKFETNNFISFINKNNLLQ